MLHKGKLNRGTKLQYYEKPNGIVFAKNKVSAVECCSNTMKCNLRHQKKFVFAPLFLSITLLE